MEHQARHPADPRLPEDETASATIKGFEVMRMIRRGHCGLAQRDVEAKSAL